MGASLLLTLYSQKLATKTATSGLANLLQRGNLYWPRFSIIRNVLLLLQMVGLQEGHPPHRRKDSLMLLALSPITLTWQLAPDAQETSVTDADGVLRHLPVQTEYGGKSYSHLWRSHHLSYAREEQLTFRVRPAPSATGFGEFPIDTRSIPTPLFPPKKS